MKQSTGKRKDGLPAVPKEFTGSGIIFLCTEDARSIPAWIAEVVGKILFSHSTVG